MGSTRLWGIGILLVACGGAIAQSEPALPLSTKLDVAYVTRYVWRGIPQTNEAAVQPSLTVSHPSGLSLNLWASQDIDAGQMRENDYTLNYAWEAGGATMNAGFIYYAFPNTSFASTSELYASTCFGGPLSPSVSVNYDVDEARGLYASLSADYACCVPWSKGSPTNLNLFGKLSFSSAAHNGFWFGVNEAAVSDLYLSASIPVSLGGSATLTPSIGYSTVIDGALRDALSSAGLEPDNLIGSLTLSREF